MIFQLKPLAQHNFLVGEEGGELREAELEVVVGGFNGINERDGCVSTTVTTQCTCYCTAKRPGSTALCVRLFISFMCICE